MSSTDKNIAATSDEYWKKMDELFAIAERKNIISAISKTDTEKFYEFTKMMRITNTLKKAKIVSK
ncbi:MAG: hypothetical protein WDM90_22510 [Ferruginibacter sp.]